MAVAGKPGQLYSGWHAMPAWHGDASDASRDASLAWCTQLVPSSPSRRPASLTRTVRRRRRRCWRRRFDHGLKTSMSRNHSCCPGQCHESACVRHPSHVSVLTHIWSRYLLRVPVRPRLSRQAPGDFPRLVTVTKTVGIRVGWSRPAATGPELRENASKSTANCCETRRCGGNEWLN